MSGKLIAITTKGRDNFIIVASHRAGFFYFTTKEVFRWLTIKRIFPASENSKKPSGLTEKEMEQSL